MQKGNWGMDDEYKQSNKRRLPGYVYLIDFGDGKTFKIGQTKHEPELRLHQIAKGNVIMPMQLVMEVYTETNCGLLETLLHMNFDNNHIRGEWFRFDFFDLVDIYQAMSSFGGARLHDRWYELVPDGYDKFIEGGRISSKLPYFDKKEAEIPDFDELDELFGRVAFHES
jgi:hypothetical protein